MICLTRSSVLDLNLNSDSDLSGDLGVDCSNYYCTPPDLLVADAGRFNPFSYFDKFRNGSSAPTGPEINGFVLFGLNDKFNKIAGGTGPVQVGTEEASLINSMNPKAPKAPKFPYYEVNSAGFNLSQYGGRDNFINQPVEHFKNQFNAVKICDEILSPNNYSDLPFVVPFPSSQNISIAQEQACSAAASGAFSSRDFGPAVAQKILSARLSPYYPDPDRSVSIYEHNYQVGLRYAQAHPERSGVELVRSLMGSSADFVYRSAKAGVSSLPQPILSKE
jgi:hypothetical protein